MGERIDTRDVEEQLAILQSQLRCLEEGGHVDDLDNDITMTPVQIHAEIERILRKFHKRESRG